VFIRFLAACPPCDFTRCSSGVKISPPLEKLFDILHEDTDLLVINKPAGLVCHPTKGDEFSSLISRARLYLKPSTLNPQPSTHLVNRLDRETSGIVLIAKNSAVAGELGKLWEARAVRKEYLAIVHGHVRDDHGLIDAPLGKDERSIVAVKDCVRPDGAPAQTEFWVERRFNRRLVRHSSSKVEKRARGGVVGPSSIHHLPLSLLRVIPRTGRKHQLRLHLAHLGHPIVGDKLYGGDEDLYLALVENRLTDEQHARLILPHHALHACAVRFVWRGRLMEFLCDPEPWFVEFCQPVSQVNAD
jgi:23S rRNA pseudouridine1911/1915/1917 synthase